MAHLIHNFLALQSFNIFTSLIESLLFLIKIYCEFYFSYPFLSYKYDTKTCEHFFDVAKQLHNNFKYNNILNLISKITYYTKSIKMRRIVLNKEKTMCKDMFAIYISIYYY